MDPDVLSDVSLSPEMKDRVVGTFTYHKPDDGQIADMQAIRVAARRLAGLIMQHCPACPDRSAAIRKLRECVMTANAAIVIPESERL